MDFIQMVHDAIGRYRGEQERIRTFDEAVRQFNINAQNAADRLKLDRERFSEQTKNDAAIRQQAKDQMDLQKKGQEEFNQRAILTLGAAGQLVPDKYGGEIAGPVSGMDLPVTGEMLYGKPLPFKLGKETIFVKPERQQIAEVAGKKAMEDKLLRESRFREMQETLEDFGDILPERMKQTLLFNTLAPGLVNSSMGSPTQWTIAQALEGDEAGWKGLQRLAAIEALKKQKLGANERPVKKSLINIQTDPRLSEAWIDLQAQIDQTMADNKITDNSPEVRNRIGDTVLKSASFWTKHKLNVAEAQQLAKVLGGTNVEFQKTIASFLTAPKPTKK